MSVTDCAICGADISLAWACTQTHPDHCHACWHESLRGSMESREHRPSDTLGLSPRDVQALVGYQQRVQRLREEDTPDV
jgi:hypothetical protein